MVGQPDNDADDSLRSLQRERDDNNVHVDRLVIDAERKLATLRLAVSIAGPGVWVICGEYGAQNLLAAADSRIGDDDDEKVAVELDEKVHDDGALLSPTCTRSDHPQRLSSSAVVLLRPDDNAPRIGALHVGALIDVDGVYGDWLQLAGECAWTRCVRVIRAKVLHHVCVALAVTAAITEARHLTGLQILTSYWHRLLHRWCSGDARRVH
jgi:hypothetical protein